MIRQQWQLILAVECIFLCISNQSVTEKRRCAYQVKPQNKKYTHAGNVSGSVQVCEFTHCCVGYFLMVDGQLEVDLLACDMAERSCPDATCKAQPRNSKLMKCMCNTHLCNGNITWTTESKEPQLTDSNSLGKIMIILIALIVLLLVIASVTWKYLFAEKKTPQASPHDSPVSPLCSCQTIKTSKIDIANVELQQVVARGHFASVWQGKYRVSKVAVKVVPAGWKNAFTTEREVYELPLMKHPGIVHFLGTGRKPDGDSWCIVLQFAEHGSLHSFLHQHTNSWMSSLRMCLSLSQGLSYLHSDLHRHDVHKPPVAHRDLSSFNVLVKADGTCALSDFSCATILRSCAGEQRWQSDTRDTEGHAQTGTLCYMPPEILEGSVNLDSNWCLRGDVYALGLVLWEILMRCCDLFEGNVAPQHLLPYESELGASVTWENLTCHVSRLEKRPSIPKQWKMLPQGSVLEELLEDCWDSEPDARLTAQCAESRLVSLHACHSL